jgi:hypothetical protein
VREDKEHVERKIEMAKRRIAEQLMREELPYGMSWYENGAKVLFNRKYEVVRSKGPEPVGARKQAYYYDDSNPPWRNPKTKARCEAVLREWDRP